MTTIFDRSTVFQSRHSIHLLLAKAGLLKPEAFTDIELVNILLSTYYAPIDRDELRPIYERILTADVRRRLLSRGQVRQ